MKGRCLCGAIEYEISGTPEDAYYCHCRDCQRSSGSPFHILAIVKRGALQVRSGAPASYKSATDSGFEMTRAFCAKCGTPLFFESTRFPDIRMFTVTTLEDPEAIRPSFEIWTTSMVSWARTGDDVESFPCGALDGRG